MTFTNPTGASRARRFAAGLLGLTVLGLVPLALGTTLGALGGRAIDFSGRALTVGERLLYAAVPIGVVALGWVARAIWRGNRVAMLIGSIFGLGVGALLVARLIGGFANAPPGGIAIDPFAIGGLVVVAGFELLLRQGARASTQART